MYDITELSKNASDEIIYLRRQLHKIPEYGDELPLTTRFVEDWLIQHSIPYSRNKEGGIVALVEGKSEGSTIAFRADMDALNIKEQTELPFSSVCDGRMHACGHDAHTAMLMVAAKILNEHKEQLSGKVKFFFQSGEETGSGAKIMINNGHLDSVDAIFTIHVGDLAGEEYEAGTLVIVPGAVSAGKMKFTIQVNGKSTHSAFPEKGIDPILIASRIINSTEELMARELPANENAVLSFGSITAGKDHNTIPDNATIKGSIRAQKDETRMFLANRLTQLSQGIATAFRGSADIDIIQGSKTILNDELLSGFVFSEAVAIFDEKTVVNKPNHALMGSDDFANYLQTTPGVYFFLCTNNKEKGIMETNHHPKFDVDEDVLWKGVAMYLSIAHNYNDYKMSKL